MVYLIAGEPSGDLHGARLARALQAERPGLALRGLGGPAMREAGVDLLEDVTRHANMGLVEVIGQLGYYVGLLSRLEDRIRADRPKAVVLIDFPDFNLRLASRLAGSGIPVFYYIAPQVWAWRAWRVRAMRRTLRKVFVIFPFEVEFYRAHGVDAEFVGHPLIGPLSEENGRPREALAAELGLDPSARWVGLFPGSRRGIFHRLWGPFCTAARRIAAIAPDVRFLLGAAPALGEAWVGERASEAGFPVKVVTGRSRDAMRVCEAALIASGTGALEAGLLELPHVVAYRVHWLTAMIGLALVRTRDFAMSNILAGRRIVPEFVQHRATPEALAAPVIEWLRDPSSRQLVKAELSRLRPMLGPPGAAARTARSILESAGA